jgi:hypothetical protein
LCCDERLICKETEIPDENYFIAHREDQSILSVLCKLSGINPHKDPSQFANFPKKYKINETCVILEKNHDDIYNNVIYLHRQQRVTIIMIIKLIVQSVLPNKFLSFIFKKTGRIKHS